MKHKPAFSVIFENDEIIAVNKAAGIAVSGDRWDDSKERLDEMVGAYLAEPAAIPGGRIYRVHRIDRDTSGVVVFAKNAAAHKRLSKAFESRLVEKKYIAVVYGRPAWKETACELSLVPDGDKKHRTIVDIYRGKKSLTRFRLLGAAGNYGVIEALPETGRTHQIRVHLASLGHPIVRDELYGRAGSRGIRLSSFKSSWRGDPLDERPLLDRLALHASSLILEEEKLEFFAPLPKDMASLFKQMKKAVPDSFAEIPS